MSTIVPKKGIEPSRPYGPRDFKSRLSTSSNTWAFKYRSNLISLCLTRIPSNPDPHPLGRADTLYSVGESNSYYRDENPAY